MPTQRRLAELAGVTQACVSLALRGSPRVGLETRRRIAALAEDHGYRADPALGALARRRWSAPAALALAYLAPRLAASSRDRYAEGVVARCAALGLRLWQVPRGADAAGLARRRIAGAIVGQTTILDRPPSLPPGLRVVHCGVIVPPGPGDLACADLAGAGPTAWAALNARGHRRVAAAVLADPRAWSDQLLAGGLLACARVAGGGRLTVWVGPPDQRGAAVAWLRARRADALLAYDPDLADALRRMGESRPIATLVGLPDRPDLAGTVLPFAEVGARAVDLLVERLRDQPSAPGTRRMDLVAMPWREGASLVGGFRMQVKLQRRSTRRR